MGIFSHDEDDDYPYWLVTHPMYVELMDIMREYNKAVALPHIKNPKAYALYQVWKKVDSQGAKGNDNDT